MTRKLIMGVIRFPRHQIERYSNSLRAVPAGITQVKRCNYSVYRGKTVMGDAPKELVRIYSYSKDNHFRKINVKRWPLYIAKTGHKWYPIESITERLLCRFGEVFGLRMAESGLAMIGGQVRFLSKFFLNGADEELVHGAEIFAGYIGDEELVAQIEEQQLSRDMFTLQFVEKSVEYQFAFCRDEIMREFIKMLLFDALVGNNDRHFYNWGVIRSITRAFQPYFAPVYDTARGLFWNDTDEKLENRYKNHSASYLKKYCEGSRPKIGWDGEKNINHFGLVEKIYSNEFFLCKNEIKALFLQSNPKKMFEVIDSEFSHLMSETRIKMIKLCLEYRYNTIVELLK